MCVRSYTSKNDHTREGCLSITPAAESISMLTPVASLEKTWFNLSDDLVNLKCQTMTTKQEAQGALSTALSQGFISIDFDQS